MSEPDIATLARRLAEQNNVDWRTLSGTGPDGKIVERDVLDYLARVMAGDEAVNPTPEPLPDGMEAWPDQDAPAYFKPNGHSQSAQAEGAAQAVGDAADDLLADFAGTDDVGADLIDAGADADGDTDDDAFGAAAADAWEPAAEAFPPATDVDAEVDFGQGEAVFAEPAADEAAGDDVELSDDIFLFDDEDDALEEVDPDDALLVADDEDDVVTAGTGGHAAEHAHDAVGFAGDLAEDLAADVSTGLNADLGAELEADFGADLGADLGADHGADHGADLGVDLGGSAEPAPAEDEGEASDVFAASVESYDQEFTTPSEQFEDETDLSSWGSGDLSDLGDLSDETPVMSDASVEEGGDLPELWASDAQADAEEPTAEDVTADLTEQHQHHPAAEADAEEEAAVAWGEGYGAVDVDAEASTEAAVDVAEADESAADADEPSADPADEHAAAPGYDHTWSDAVTAADDVVDLEQAEALDEQDAVADLEALDGQPEVPAAALAGLPFMRTGNVMRRHVDLSALANAQLAAGMELGHDEPLSPAPFLLRAVAKAAAELGAAPGQVALAELGGEVRYRRVDDAANRSFGSLVDELTGQGQEEDEIGLVAVDLSAFDMDELLLDVEAPAVTLGRVLYDTQRGAHRSTLTLSGDLPLTEGANLLARVAELLETPIRLLL